MNTVALSRKKRTAREKIFIDIPQSDIVFFKLFADKMGWSINNKQNLWDEYIKTSPKNVDLSDEEIMEEVRAIRYEKIQDNH
ncbi:hypothetical protein AGMMS50262_16270 [Bacteroidia bacterium]|nr:hypothetical protein AGMMS50262_16270 [Bacteroidia bacterium]